MGYLGSRFARGVFQAIEIDLHLADAGAEYPKAGEDSRTTVSIADL
jgi:hypothetical protein